VRELTDITAVAHVQMQAERRRSWSDLLGQQPSV
jgi:hypothetical protein